MTKQSAAATFVCQAAIRCEDRHQAEGREAVPIPARDQAPSGGLASVVHAR